MSQAPPPTHPRRGRRRARNIALAVFFFILGVIGVLVPIMPQVPFFVMSLLFLSLASRRVHRAVRRFLHRYPKVEASFHGWRHKRRAKRRGKIRRQKAVGSRQ
jgi:uncharacterized membrane protein YbaN (DUF454 family)